ncbi:conserved hypothetical protein [Nitrosopumilaceae archaeon]|nr:hypothetical protein [Nitrosopumilus sp.]CAI9830735.1 conserved hypothetical protein [Nitrosopumilaceae archaeon]MDA7945257.1 hypothetical protein [Nitrosopumilus sp.]MDA7955195.1 hypothetical protein [Nitrosopumilus sp.]MDA7974330.1 hypothetical protein [Nitrosopumilus sp.]
MQELAIAVGSIAGAAATAAAVRGRPRVRLPSVRPRSELGPLEHERRKLSMAITMLHEPGPYTDVQRDRLLALYQRRLGDVLARIEKASRSRYPDLGTLGDGIAEMLDQRMAGLDERLREMSARIQVAPAAKAEQAARAPKTEQARPRAARKEAAREIPREERRPEAPRPSFELTTLTSVGGAPRAAPAPMAPPAEAAMPEVAPASEVAPARQEAPREAAPAGPAAPPAAPPRADPKPAAGLPVVSPGTEIAARRPEAPAAQDARPEAPRAAPSEPDLFDDEDDYETFNNLKKDMDKVLSKMNQAELE